ncbi:MAG: HAD-IA family hydrolase [Gammaproteobacteria bacterium]|nr:HAD-IA family hydrolase [Gammaproteobacteria bacterium]MCP5425414.1 HAD-IA family hydrolase [Gammaproteobacteria bacterium]
MNRPFDLVVFDWDGTLMDSTAHIVACLQAAAVDVGLTPPAEEAARNIIGLSLLEACRALFPNGELADPGLLADAYRKHFFVTPQPSRLFADAIPMASTLRDQGYLLAVATGKSRRGLQSDLEATGFGRWLDASRCADETASKPDPLMLLEILEELGVEAQRALMVGDTEYDLVMARNAGVRSMAVSGGAHESTRLLAHQPLACLASLSELPQTLAALPMQSAAIFSLNEDKP